MCYALTVTHASHEGKLRTWIRTAIWSDSAIILSIAGCVFLPAFMCLLDNVYPSRPAARGDVRFEGFRPHPRAHTGAIRDKARWRRGGDGSTKGNCPSDRFVPRPFRFRVCKQRARVACTHASVLLHARGDHARHCSPPPHVDIHESTPASGCKPEFKRSHPR